jgi:hypothetical protein
LIAPSCLSKWRRLRREGGALKPGKMNDHKKRALSGAIAEWLRERLGSAPFTTRRPGRLDIQRSQVVVAAS